MKKLLLAILCLLPVSWIMGQSQHAEVNAVESDSSIVRHWDGSYNVIYSNDSIRNNQFLLFDTSSLTVSSIPLPDNVKVQDFRIMDDWIYFCGHIGLPSAQYGLLGCANLYDFVNGSGPIHWMAIQPTSMPDCYSGGCYDRVTDITRLALYKVSGAIQVAYIANNDLVDDLDDDNLRVGIGWAEFDGSHWNKWLMYNKYAEEYYTDIIATDNYVAAVGRTNDSSYLCMRIFAKGDFLVPSYTMTGLPFYHDHFGFRMSDLVLASNAVAAPVEGDTFAVAYNYLNGSGGLSVKKIVIIGGSPILINDGVTALGASVRAGKKIRDAAYSIDKQTLFVLDDGYLGGDTLRTSLLYKVLHVNFSSGSCVVESYSGLHLHSLDIMREGGSVEYIVSGNSAAQSPLNVVYEEAFAYSSCGTAFNEYAKVKKTRFYNNYMETNMIQHGIYENDYSIQTVPMERHIICNK